MNDKINKQEELDDNKEGTNGNASNITPDDHNDETSSKYDGDTVPKEMTRSTLALTFVIGFFAVILLCFIYSCCHGFSVGDLKDLLLTASGILSGSMGFVLGYYFKGGEKQQ